MKPLKVESLRRADLHDVSIGYIKKGAWNKADVILIGLPECEFAVKDYGRKWLPVRLTGAWQLRREIRAYRRLEGVAGVPRLRRVIDRHAIVLDYIGGIRLPKYHRRQGGLPQVARRVKDLLDAVHRRGIIHGDLRSRDNFLVTTGGDLFLIDFSSSTVFDPESWLGRVVFPRLIKAEERALLKWKVALAPQELTEEELERHRAFKRFRRFWPFNRKKDLPQTRGRNPLL